MQMKLLYLIASRRHEERSVGLALCEFGKLSRGLAGLGVVSKVTNYHVEFFRDPSLFSGYKRHVIANGVHWNCGCDAGAGGFEALDHLCAQIFLNSILFPVGRAGTIG